MIFCGLFIVMALVSAWLREPMGIFGWLAAALMSLVPVAARADKKKGGRS